MGTGGTLTGCARLLKSRNPDLKVFAVEPALSSVLAGGNARPHLIQGIGAGFIPSVLDTSLIDEVIAVTDDEAMTIGRRLAKEEGLLSGVSSGAAVAAALTISARSEMSKKRIVVVLPSFGERYLSTPMFSGITSTSTRADNHL